MSSFKIIVMQVRIIESKERKPYTRTGRRIPCVDAASHHHLLLKLQLPAEVKIAARPSHPEL